MPRYSLYFIFGAFVFTFPSAAYAYLDPGTGSFVTQVLIAGFATVVLSIKILWRRIKNPFSSLSKRNDEEQK